MAPGRASSAVARRNVPIVPAMASSGGDRTPVHSPPVVIELGAGEPVSGELACGLANPMPGGVTAGYAGDTGLDIAGTPRNVFAIAAGTIEYAEEGHTLWRGKGDSPYAIRIRLDTPIPYRDRSITHVWYAHLSELARVVHEGGEEIVHVARGGRLGTSGSANGCAHLHLGMLLDGEVEQYWGTFLVEDQVRSVLCGWPATTKLPDEQAQR